MKTGLLLTVLAALGTTGMAPPRGLEPPQAASAQADPFAGVWAEEALEQAVIWPREALDKGDLVEAERRLDELLARAAGDRVERTRLMTAWAVQLMVHHSSKGDALSWLRRAATEARLGFAPDSRLRAMALADYGIFEIQSLGAEASSEAEAALVEALEVRHRTLGRGHVETLTASAALGQLRGNPARTEGRPERIDAASRLFAILLEADVVTDDRGIDQLFLEWSEMLILNDRPDAACAVLDKLPSLRSRLRLNLEFIAFQMGLQLRNAGYADHAAPLISDGRFGGRSRSNLRCGG